MPTNLKIQIGLAGHYIEFSMLRNVCDPEKYDIYTSRTNITSLDTFNKYKDEIIGKIAHLLYTHSNIVYDSHHNHLFSFMSGADAKHVEHAIHSMVNDLRQVRCVFSPI